MPDTHPAGPVPPPSRLPWHLAAAVTGAVLGPFGALWLAAGLTALFAGDGGGALPTAAGLAAVAVVATLTSRSSLGGLAAGVTTLLTAVADGVFGLVDAAPGWPTVLAAGLTMAGAGGAAHLARRAGRAVERQERAVDDPSRPPRSRLGAHLASVAVALVLVAVAVWLLDARLGDEAGAGAVAAATAGAVALGLAALSGSASSLGAQAVGGALAVVALGTAVAGALLGHEWQLPPGNAAATTLGLVLLLGGTATHFARRHGRALERLDLTLAG